MHAVPGDSISRGIVRDVDADAGERFAQDVVVLAHKSFIKIVVCWEKSVLGLDDLGESEE